MIKTWEGNGNMVMIMSMMISSLLLSLAALVVAAVSSLYGEWAINFTSPGLSVSCHQY